MPVENAAHKSHQPRNGLFRRAQSLRFPRPSASAVPAHPNSSACTSPCTTTSNNSFTRSGSRAYRSKSSRHRLGSIEAQSLLGRMSAGQRLALVQTWRQMRHQMATLVRKILVELEQQEPVVKQIFYKASYVDCFASSSASTATVANLATMDEHTRLMAKFFDELVAFVEDAGPTGTEGGEEITAMIKGLGQQHAILAHSAGLNAEVWEKLGEIAMERFCATEVVQKTREAGRAWRTLIAFMTDKIRCGFEGEVKVFSRRPSTDQQNQTDDEGEEEEGRRGREGSGRGVVALGQRLKQLRAECGWKEGERQSNGTGKGE